MTITSDDAVTIVRDWRGKPHLMPTKDIKAFHAKIKRMRDQAMNNLGKNGKPAFLPGDWNSKDESSPGSSQGTTGSATGGAPRRAERPPTPPSLREGVFTTNSALQPGGYTNSDQAEPEPDNTEGLGQVIASLEDPGPGMTYRLQQQPDGSIAIVLCEDTGDDLSMADTTMRHSLTADAKFMRRWAGILKRRGTRDWASSVPTTIFRHKNLAQGERLEIQGPDEFAGYDVVLFTPVKNLIGSIPPGSGSTAKEPRARTLQGPQAWVAAPGSKPEELSIHEIQEAVRSADSRARMTMAAIQRRNVEFWQR